MSRSQVILRFLAIMFAVLFVGVIANIGITGVDSIGPSPLNSFGHLLTLYAAILVPTASVIILIFNLAGPRPASVIYMLASFAVFIASLMMTQFSVRDGIALSYIYSIGLVVFSLYYLATLRKKSRTVTNRSPNASPVG